MDFPNKQVDNSISDEPEAFRTTPERRAKLRKIISDSAILTPEYMVMNGLSTIVAAYGLLQNSTAVVIGAMIIAMLLGPINGLALALNDSNWGLLRKAGTAEAGGAILVFLASLFIGRIHSNIPISAEMMARTAPNILDLFIALAGGAAGAYAVASPRLKAGAVGVAIATALVPPLTTAGLLIARGGMENFSLGIGALILFFTNLVTIQAAASAVFWFYGLHAPLRRTDRGFFELCRRNGISLALIGVLAIFLAYTFQSSVTETARNAEMRSQLGAFIQLKQKGSNLIDLNVQTAPDGLNVFAVVRSPNSFSPDQVGEIEDLLSVIFKTKINLFVRSILTKEASRNGWLHVPADEPTGDLGTEPTAFPGDSPTEVDTTLLGPVESIDPSIVNPEAQPTGNPPVEGPPAPPTGASDGN